MKLLRWIVVIVVIGAVVGAVIVMWPRIAELCRRCRARCDSGDRAHAA